MHDAPTDVLTDTYPEDEYFADLLRVTGGQTDEQLARMAIRRLGRKHVWMRRHGVRFQHSLGGTLHLGRTNAFFLGGGKALLNAYYAAAERLGIRIFYNAEVVDLKIGARKIRKRDVLCGWHRRPNFERKSLVVASGGFESNLEWLKEAWGDAADNFIIRGTPYNKGKLLRLLLDHGAEQVGDATQCHAVAIDGRAPKFDGGIVTRLDCVPLGIVVNQSAASASTTKAKTSGRSATRSGGGWWRSSPDQIAYSIIDSKVVGRFMPSVFPPIQGSKHRANWQARSACRSDELECTVQRFNRSVRAPARSITRSLDDCRTEGLKPAKSHWAQAIDHPPFFGYPLASRDHVHLSGRQSGRKDAGDDEGSGPRAQHLRGRRNHGRKHSRKRLSGGPWNDHRHRIRTDRREGGSACSKLIRSRKARGS